MVRGDFNDAVLFKKSHWTFPACFHQNNTDQLGPWMSTSADEKSGVVCLTKKV